MSLDQVYELSQDSVEKKEENEKSHTKVDMTREVPGRDKGIASSLCFIAHNFLSKGGGGGQLVIFHSIWGIFTENLGMKYYFFGGWVLFNIFNSC